MFRGRALLAPCLIVALWVLVRSGIYWTPDASITEWKVVAADHSVQARGSVRIGPATPIVSAKADNSAIRKSGNKWVLTKDSAAPSKPTMLPKHPQHAEQKKPVPGIGTVRKNSTNIPFRPAVKPKIEASIPDPQPPSKPKIDKASMPKRLAFYGYAYWREADNSGLAPAAQYGGSQAGLIATYRLGTKRNAPAILARISSDLDPLGNPEAAIGLRWRPLRKIPVDLTAERRFRKGAVDAFAIYMAGGVEKNELPFGLRLLSYAQAGFVLADKGQRRSDYFYDGQVKIIRKIATRGKANLSIGGGAWAGGQRGVNRLDAGPTAAIDFGFAQTDFRLSADYRFRAAGNASPKSGPAITLSASY